VNEKIEASDRSIAAGSIDKSIINTGDNSPVFLGYERLRDAVIQPSEVFRRVNIESFVGRRWLIDQVDSILNDENNRCGYLVLKAHAGLGKTAFLAWLVKERNYIHHFVELAPGNQNWFWYPILQFSENYFIQSPDYIASWDHTFDEKHTSVKNIEIEELRTGTRDLGGLTPTAGDYVFLARKLRRGAKGLRVDAAEVLRRSEIELKFEEGRRKYAPNAVSRLNCIYLVDDETVLRKMFEDYSKDYVFKVKIIQQLNCSKVDVQWYHRYWDAYSVTSDDADYWGIDKEDCIKKYWNSFPSDENANNWEYLIDGLVGLVDPRDIKRIQAIRKGLRL